MKIAAMLRVKNEARWIHHVIKSIRTLCNPIILLDDHSDDQTRELAVADGAIVYRSPFTGLDEIRDKNFLLDIIGDENPDWVLCVDGDEVLAPFDDDIIRKAVAVEGAVSYSLRIAYLWNRLDQVRIDGVYANFCRPSLFKFDPLLRFRPCRPNTTLHCTSVPYQRIAATRRCEAQLLHFGYMLAADRLRKFQWYNQIDPNDSYEDCYRHMIQGDPEGPPADARLRHAGPLHLVPLQ